LRRQSRDTSSVFPLPRRRTEAPRAVL
jgi:hypothetical protein